MSWNYRIVQRLRAGINPSFYALHEVHYDDDGLPWAMTTDPVDFVCDLEEGPEGIVEALEMALVDAKKTLVLDEPETWPGKPPGRGEPR